MSDRFTQAAHTSAAIVDGRSTAESELTAGVSIEAGERHGFFTDTTLCIGCKACEVACKDWNGLPTDEVDLTGFSYDNTRRLSSTTWRHVGFVEQIEVSPESRVTQMQPFQSNWLMMSDVCKHCSPAPCLEACPTGSLFRTEFGTVVVQQEICNGCGYCVPCCPFGVVDLNLIAGTAQKCTLCYDRLKGGFEPACAKACPTDSIQFGKLSELQERARNRVRKLQEMGRQDAYLYGTPDSPGATGGIRELNAFFLLTDKPEVYNLPSAPTRPAARVKSGLAAGLATMAAFAVAAAFSFSRTR